MYKNFTLALLFLSLSIYSQSGIMWNSEINLAPSANDNLHPRIAVDAIGNPLVIWGRSSDASVFFSRWTGTVFTNPVKLNPSWLKVATASWMGPEIAAHGDTVYVVVKRTPEASDTNHIYLMRSFNGGQTFSAPVRVDYIADSISRFPTVTTDASGNPVIAFMKFNAGFVASRWVVLKSANYGTTFSVDVKASGWNGAPGICDCCPGSIVTQGNFAAVLYRNNMSNIRDSWAGLSNNGGSTFSSGINIDNRNWMITSCPASGPDGTVIGDTMYTVFMSGAVGMYRTYLSKTSINNLTLNSVNSLTGNITGLSQQNYPTIASQGTALAIVWKHTINGSSQMPIRFTNDVRKGLPLAYDTVAPTDVTNADVALSKNKVFVVWEDDNTGTVKYRTGTFTPAGTGINKKDEDYFFDVRPNPAQGSLLLRWNVKDSKLTITNVLGQEIFSEHSTSSKNQSQLDVSGWNKGVYVITVESENFIASKKIIKQ